MEHFNFQPSTLPHKIYPFIRYFLKGYTLHILFMLCVGALWAIDLSLRPYLVKIILDQAGVISPSQAWSVLLPLVIMYITSNLYISIMYTLYRLTARQLYPHLKKEIITTLTDQVVGRSYSYFQESFAGGIANKIRDVAQGCVEIVEFTIEQVLTQFLAFSIAAYTLGKVHPLFAVLYIAWVILFALVSTWGYKHGKKLSQECSEATSWVIGNIVDILSNILNVRLFAAHHAEVKYIRTCASQMESKDKKLRLFMIVLMGAQSITLKLMTGLSLVLLVYMRKYGVVSVGDFALVLTLSVAISRELWYLSKDCHHFAEQLGLVSQGLTLLASGQAEKSDLGITEECQVSQGVITYEKVSFSYLPSRTLFKELSVSIGGGEKVGCVGYSGSGKTTFANLLLRLFEPQEGRILIDGQDISLCSQESLRRSISVIPQEPLLFHRTIRENIAYGCPQATDEEIFAAARKAQVHDFVIALPDGYHTHVGERGSKISGGQRQRIAIARAFLKNAPLLILDEATSALDSALERSIQQSLKELMKGKTALVIAHRLSTLVWMDRILVFEKGEIVEQGTHKQLMENQGLYYTLWMHQTEGKLGDEVNLHGREKSE